jgi:hypothetical protein
LRTTVNRRSARVRLSVLMSVALCTVGCKDCNPMSPASELGGAREVWVSPNIGSRDFLDLFSNPDAWSTARSKITGIGFSGSHLLDDPCGSCGENTLPNFLTVVPGGAFRWLAAHQLKIVLDAPSVKSWDCQAATTVAQTMQGIVNVTANGGTIAYVAMDEPFISALPPNQAFAASIPTCNFTVQQTASAVGAYVARINTAYPGVRVGLIEPYPYFSATQIESFITALAAVGINLPFFHLDYDQTFLSVDPAPDFLEFRNFFRQRQIPFGIIMVGTNGTNDQLATNGALVAALRISNVLGIHTLQHVLFESWLDYPPTRGYQDLRLYPDNLPDSVQTTMTGMVNQVLDNMP